MQNWGFIKGFKNTQQGRSFYALSVPLILNCADWTMHFFEPFLCTFYLTNTTRITRTKTHHQCQQKNHKTGQTNFHTHLLLSSFFVSTFTADVHPITDTAFICQYKGGVRVCFSCSVYCHIDPTGITLKLNPSVILYITCISRRIQYLICRITVCKSSISWIYTCAVNSLG